MTEDKDKAGSAKVNKSGHVKKVTITTNNRIQAGFNSTRRKKAKHWTQNQLTNRTHNYQKNTNLFGNLIVFDGHGVGHLTDLVVPGEGTIESFFARRGDS